MKDRGKAVNRAPIKATPLTGVAVKDAWFYETARSLDIYIQLEGVGVVAVALPRAAIAEWIARTA